MAKFKVLVQVKKPITEAAIFPLQFTNKYKDIRFSVLYNKDEYAFDLRVEDIHWNEIAYFAPTRNIDEDRIDTFSALINVNNEKILDNSDSIGWYSERMMDRYREQCDFKKI